MTLALVAPTTVAPCLETATMIAAVVDSQLVFSLLLDRFGLFDLLALPLTA